jgi:hypothetical protein
MKKLLYRSLIFGVPLLLLCVGCWLYGKYSDYRYDNRVYVTAQRHAAKCSRPPDKRLMSVFDVEVKRTHPFDASLRLGFYPLKNENEDGMQEYVQDMPLGDKNPYRVNFADVNIQNIDVPERPAKFSYRDGMWVVRLYIHAYEDGSVVISDERFGEKDKAIASFTPPPPQKRIRWGLAAGGSTTYSESTLGFGCDPTAVVAQGWEGEPGDVPVLLRYTIFVGAWTPLMRDGEVYGWN